MTPKGEIRALYSAPTYDPNVFVGGISSADWRPLNTDPARPLLNRAIQARYPPASPFKLATAAMALKRGLIDLQHHMPVPCRGGFRLGNRVFRCWKKEGHGSLDLIGAVAASCDVYFYQLGQRLGLDAIIEEGVLMGFRDRSGIDLRERAEPDLSRRPPAYFDRLYGPRNWSPPGTTLNFSIGQGENTQTLINMVQFYQGLAGDGDAPHAVHRAADATAGTRSSGSRRAAAGRAPPRADRGGGAGHRAASRRGGLAVAGQDRHRAEPARQGPRLVHRVRAGREAGARGRRDHGGRRARLHRGAVRGRRRSGRYILGPDATGPVKLGVLLESRSPRADTAPRPIELDPDSAAARAAAADSARRAGPSQ